ncbi:NADPH-dependent FMN reductase [Paraherbaspirillum soli]|uniref:NADPH-dependent FMN reductase n=1 Tax=Paraherbaspirillum soli TaxID=631222 RepID=A0ABW0MG40_9BURK
MIKLLAISGSLRQASANTALLRAAIGIAPRGAEITLYEGVGQLPQFNPDIEHAAPPIVEDLRNRLIACDGVIIASPEYAHGVPGAFKNALDWVVGSVDLAGKPVALLNASGRATHAQAALAEIIMTMGWLIVNEASLVIPVAGKELDAAAILADPALTGQLHEAVGALLHAIEIGPPV